MTGLRARSFLCLAAGDWTWYRSLVSSPPRRCQPPVPSRRCQPRVLAEEACQARLIPSSAPVAGRGARLFVSRAEPRTTYELVSFAALITCNMTTRERSAGFSTPMAGGLPLWRWRRPGMGGRCSHPTGRSPGDVLPSRSSLQNCSSPRDAVLWCPEATAVRPLTAVFQRGYAELRECRPERLKKRVPIDGSLCVCGIFIAEKSNARELGRTF